MRSLTLAAALAALVLALAACGGDDGGGGGGGGEDAAQTGEQVRVSLTDFEIDPAEIHLDGAGTYTFVVENDGEAPHAFEIEGGDVHEESATLDPGASDELTVELAEGEYETYCPVGDHADRGMTGTLTVGGTETHTETETGETETETGETETETGETETDDDGGGLGY